MAAQKREINPEDVDIEVVVDAPVAAVSGAVVGEESIAPAAFSEPVVENTPEEPQPEVVEQEVVAPTPDPEPVVEQEQPQEVVAEPTSPEVVEEVQVAPEAVVEPTPEVTEPVAPAEPSVEDVPQPRDNGKFACADPETGETVYFDNHYDMSRWLAARKPVENQSSMATGEVGQAAPNVVLHTRVNVQATIAGLRIRGREFEVPFSQVEDVKRILREGYGEDVFEN